MQPLAKLDEVQTPDGKRLALYQRGVEFFIRVDGRELMTSSAHGSEEQLARLACRELGTVRAPRALIGGLGMGFTLRAALDALPAGAKVTVAEVFEAVVGWNERWLGPLAGQPLRDGRVALAAGDVFDLLEPQRYDLILLDVDNGPEALSLGSNQRLYDDAGLQRLRRALTARGVLAVWSATASVRFVRRLRAAGLDARCVAVRIRASTRGARHTIFLARRGRDSRPPHRYSRRPRGGG